LVTDVHGLIDVLIRFWGQKSQRSKSQQAMNTISHKPMNGILPNFGDGCIWLVDVLVSFSDQRSKVKVTTNNNHNVPDECKVFLNI